MEAKLLEWFNQNFHDSEDLLADVKRNFQSSPGRVTKGFKELLSGYQENIEDHIKITLELNQDYHGLVSAFDIPFMSFCPHHFLPFFGTIDVIYEPGDYIIGIGKIPRIVDCRSKRFQIQEILTKEICEDFINHAKARSCIVKSTAQHLCVCFRGPNKPSVKNKVVYSLGNTPLQMTTLLK